LQIYVDTRSHLVAIKAQQVKTAAAVQRVIAAAQDERFVKVAADDAVGVFGGLKLKPPAGICQVENFAVAIAVI
jgi:hypothetical protein